LNHPSELDVTTPGVADIVRDFYDKYPYPQPIDNLDPYRQLWQDPQRRRADYHLFWPTRSYRDDSTILIAGCGTSQAAKHALRWPQAQVVGIDFSATSVRYTEALKQKYNLNNLRVYQLPIEQASELATQFDQIVCTGVLHHLEHPDAGLQALRGLLKPDGAMHLMVYAPYGRTGIYLLQEFCRRIGIQAADADIRDLMVALKALPPGHPLEHLLRAAPDFRQEAELADALLHPHDRAYSVPQLFDLIEGAGFAFGRWVKQAPYLPQCGVIARLPQAARIAQLPPVEQYAAVELFRGTLVRHSAIVYRNDFSGNPQPIGFTGDAWLDYVPVRQSNTISVQEKLPPATAAVLINQTHSYTDLFLPINAAEKHLFDAIDGVRRIGEMVKQTQSAASRDAARAFFERLWWYDQVVFDAAPQSGENSARRTSQ
jgi:SAM-dependent methyltransferase